MVANIAAVPPLEETTPSLMTRDRIVAFVNDDLSAAALRTGLEGTNLEVKRGTIRNATFGCSKLTPSYSPWWQTLAGSMIRSLHWKTWHGFARLMCWWP